MNWKKLFIKKKLNVDQFYSIYIVTLQKHIIIFSIKIIFYYKLQIIKTLKTIKYLSL